MAACDKHNEVDAWARKTIHYILTSLIHFDTIDVWDTGAEVPGKELWRLLFEYRMHSYVIELEGIRSELSRDRNEIKNDLRYRVQLRKANIGFGVAAAAVILSLVLDVGGWFRNSDPVNNGIKQPATRIEIHHLDAPRSIPAGPM